MDKTIICFHNPEEENGYLSNWYLSDFVVDGVKYTSVEQYMMYGKAKLFSDQETQDRILAVTDVAKIKALGREVSSFDDDIWKENREKIVYTGLKAKFLHNEELRRALLSTGEAIIAECAVHDRVWGIGLSMHDNNRFNLDKWRGLNLLGYLLMDLRQELRNSLKASQGSGLNGYSEFDVVTLKKTGQQAVIIEVYDNKNFLIEVLQENGDFETYDVSLEDISESMKE